jgi:hypothetical protein
VLLLFFVVVVVVEKKGAERRTIKTTPSETNEKAFASLKSFLGALFRSPPMRFEERDETIEKNANSRKSRKISSRKRILRRQKI